MRNVHKLLLIAVCLPFNAAVAQSSNPHTPHLDALADASSYPLYCQGPLVTGSGATPKTAFKWASKGAGAASPGPGECAWADRAPGDIEIQGDGNVLTGPLNQAASLPAGQFARIGVHRGPKSNEMVVLQVVLVTPPFSAVPEGVYAYVPSLAALNYVRPAISEAAKEIAGVVRLLMTIDATGIVTQAEVLTGPKALRETAIEAVKQQKYRPVLRDARPVSAYIGEAVNFMVEGKSSTSPLNISDELEAVQRLRAISRVMPRSPAQILADLEQDAGGGDEMRRFYALADLAKAALEAGVSEKAAAYANELLLAASQHRENWNYGNAIHDGSLVLGLLAVRQGNTEEAGEYLLDAGSTPGSPQLNSFGPDMSLAKELLEKDQRDAVLEYFSRCRSFWEMGVARLDEWSEIVRAGGMPDFRRNLRL